MSERQVEDERILAEYEDLAVRRRVTAYEDFFSPTTDRSARALLDRLDAPGHGLAVDIGCGPGTLLAELQARGWQALGVDLVEAMLQRARARGTAARLVVADAGALPFAGGVADLVVMAFVAPHVADLDSTMQEARRVLRPGGRLACVTWRESHRSPLTGLAFDVLRRRGRLSADVRALLDDLDDRAGRLPAAAAAAELTPLVVEDAHDERCLAGPDEWWRGLVAASIGLAGILQPFSPQERRQARADFCAAAEAFRAEEGLRVPVACSFLVAERT